MEAAHFCGGAKMLLVLWTIFVGLCDAFLVGNARFAIMQKYFAWLHNADGELFFAQVCVR